MKIALLLLFAASALAAPTPSMTLPFGYITRVRCEGRLLLSAVGEPGLIALDALPGNIGCGVLLKPLVKTGRTNLVLETSTGSISVIVEIIQTTGRPTASQLEVNLRASE